MFGDKLILGEYERHLDEKGRIVLPSETGVEPKDVLAIEVLEKLHALRLYSYLKTAEVYYGIKGNASILDDMSKALNDARAYCKKFSGIRNVDNQLRIPLGIFMDDWKKGDTLFLQGEGESLLITKK